MADITMCTNQKCPQKHICYRSQAKPGEHQSMAEFEFVIIDGVVKCKMFYPIQVKL